jgi:predicted nucleic acid-binding protein
VTGVVYLDASAAVKLVVEESDHAALAAYLAAAARRISSRVLDIEVLRAVRRIEPAAEEQARALLAVTERIELDAEIASQAVGLGPLPLRSLDAIHIASALALGPELEAFVTYDRRQADAARAAGLNVAAPAVAD